MLLLLSKVRFFLVANLKVLVMSTKKVIAICQSGGEFVTNKDGSLAYSGGDAYAIDIDQDTSMSDFKSELAENFGFSWETMTLKYFLPGNKKTLITISKDKDFKRMVSFSADAANVEIFVLPEEVDARNVSNMPASRCVFLFLLQIVNFFFIYTC